MSQVKHQMIIQKSNRKLYLKLAKAHDPNGNDNNIYEK